MKKGQSWAPSSGVGFIPGDGRPTPGDMIIDADLQERLRREAEQLGNPHTSVLKNLPKPNLTGIKIKIPNTVSKAK